jgi:hypothetical protein
MLRLVSHFMYTTHLQSWSPHPQISINSNLSRVKLPVPASSTLIVEAIFFLSMKYSYISCFSPSLVFVFVIPCCCFFFSVWQHWSELFRVRLILYSSLPGLVAPPFSPPLPALLYLVTVLTRGWPCSSVLVTVSRESNGKKIFHHFLHTFLCFHVVSNYSLGILPFDTSTYLICFL